MRGDRPALTRAHLAEKLRPLVGSTTEARAVVDDFFEALSAGIAKNGVASIRSFGVFKCLEKKARTGRNPRTKRAAHIKARRVVTFIAAGKLKETVATGAASRENAAAAGAVKP